ncbi:MAG: hypothetical protein B7Y56_01975 [Gallionellales bacterium 35-53-114]|jgi:hypothetical protein|nr:MAG: hypothetical protein B7Y56_01975 [Gallionellales bacterium 35-53-114]OYZ64391.1 MAG: hypothetical protein B7Y04_05755 [Gallionellales bacterium 24-53-125]OZB10301.1 MAG: hypothetical protein B7X61_01950 [Gallionellales bacterium 39-52-133]
MPESNNFSRTVIPEHLMLIRLAQSEQMREFFIQVWMQNPALARQGGSRVQNLMSSLKDKNAEEKKPDAHLSGQVACTDSCREISHDKNKS